MHPMLYSRRDIHVIAICIVAMLAAVPSLAFAATPSAPTTRPAAKRAYRPAKPKGPVRGEMMDYGPFVSCSVLRPRTASNSRGAKDPAESSLPHAAKTDGGELLAVRGIVIHVGNNATVCFDTDLMSLAGGWTGGFLDMSHSNLGQYKGDLPNIVKGDLQFSTLTGPGWAKEGNDFSDTRPNGIGPLPKEWAHYKGLHRHGNQVVLSYSVGNTDVLEMEGSVAAGGHVGFTRTLQVGKSDAPQRMLVCDLQGATRVWYGIGKNSGRPADQGDAMDKAEYHSVTIDSEGGSETHIEAIGLPAGATFEVKQAKVELVIPPHEKPQAFKLVIGRLPQGNGAEREFASLVKSASKVEDLPALCHAGPALWPKPIETQATRGLNTWAYTVDTVRIPEENPWKAWIRTSALDFFPDGRAAVATFSGDVWIVSGLDSNLSHPTWKRFAAGLYEPLGLKIVEGKIYVLGRDQLTILHDLNNDGEADYYENFCNAWPASPIYHAFLMDLQTDSQGNFYFSTCGNQAPMALRLTTYGYILKVPKDGSSYERYANGVRAANGMGIGPHDEIVTADNQGNWTPVDRIDLVKKGGFYGFYYDPRRIKKDQMSALGFPDQYDPPICWIRYPSPDNSAGGQVWGGPNWGPLSGKLLCLSYGQSDLMELMWEEKDGVPQGGVVKLPLKFESGVMRARVNPRDGQVWVCGLKGWQTNAVHDGCLQRIRYTGKPANLPSALHVMKDGISISFTDPLDKSAAGDDQNYGIEQWNYRWTEVYGSPEFKASNPKQQGHDDVNLSKAIVSDDGKTVLLKTDPLKPVMQMAIQMHLKAGDGSTVDWEIDNTINKLPEETAKAGQ